MPFRFTPVGLPEVILIQPAVFPDARGFFMELYKYSEFSRNGIAEQFVQANHSHSSRNTLRGLHYQKKPQAQGKLVRAVIGEIFDVVVDIRKGSPRYGRWAATRLSASNNNILYIPPGFAHGAWVMSDEASLLYMVTQEYAPECEAGVIWNDPELAICWPAGDPVLSERDRKWPPLCAADNNFTYEDSALQRQ
ncbi:MAG TPA: dTDP-4-dehydrorhamnose 3,5-epimerase [Candidatus Binatia bacterium]|nr:dTDP-4-dehydrorhamnose 3,5-epimerase [Candidatus Binatia bacterium]